MPQPISVGSTYNSPQCLLERPKCCAVIGAIAGEWAYIESCLCRIFDHAHSPTSGIQHSSNPTAVAIFYSIAALPARLDLVQTVLRLRVPSVADEFTALRPSLRKAGKLRNIAVHTPWHLSDDYPDDLLVERLDGRKMLYTEQDLRQFLDRITPTRNEAHRFIIKVANAPKREPQSPKP